MLLNKRGLGFCKTMLRSKVALKRLGNMLIMAIANAL
jgi:hypothetical protein